MLKTIVFLDRLMKKSNIDVSENLRVSRNRDLPDVPDDSEDELLLARAMGSDEESYGLLIANKLWRFLRSRTLRYKFSDNADFVVNGEPQGSLNIGVSVRPIEALEEGRGKMKNMGPLLMMMAAKTGMVGALLLKGLFLLAGKALIVSKIALLLAVIISLKKLLSQKKTIVEVPSHHDSYSAGWSRALDGFVEGLAEVPAHFLAQQDAQDMAYGAQQPAKITQ
ncbi:Osi3 [Drosophila busckii]|uniref:Osi3 n=2 Tax=Drosophila busckii TaxID=30019 RepID=A0A0M4EJ37_DROBS|nr:Osi3 [Drosophila busckii]